MIDGGVLQLGNSAALGSGGLIVVVGTLDLAGYSRSIAVLSGAAGAITNSSTSESTLSVVPLSTTTFGGAIDDGPTGKVTLVLEGSGTLVLCGTDTYTGGTFVDAGTLVLTQATALPAGESLTVGAGGTFVFDPSVAAAPVETARGAAAAVPEPGTLALLSMAGVVAAAASGGGGRDVMPLSLRLSTHRCLRPLAAGCGGEGCAGIGCQVCFVTARHVALKPHIGACSRRT